MKHQHKIILKNLDIVYCLTDNENFFLDLQTRGDYIIIPVAFVFKFKFRIHSFESDVIFLASSIKSIDYLGTIK